MWLLSCGHIFQDMTERETALSISTTPTADVPNVCSRNGDYYLQFFEFDDSRDRAIFRNLGMQIRYLIMGYLLTSSITFCGSLLFSIQLRQEQLQHILLLNDMLTIDISSAILVSSGFLVAFIFKRTVDCPLRDVLLFLCCDMWLATLLIALAGVVQRVIQEKMDWEGFVLTLFEGLSSIRLFDLHHTVDGMHSWNVFAWLVQCMFLPSICVSYTYECTQQLHTSFKDIGLYLIGFFCFGGIILFSTFSSLEPNSDVFYSNASNIGYRIVEFNLGVNLLYLYATAEPFTTMIFQVFHTCDYIIWMVFACVWWSEIGILPTVTDEACIRLYFMNGCIRDHAAVLLRGCLLGVTMIATAIKSDSPHMENLTFDMCLLTAYSSVLLCTPIYTIIAALLRLSFTSHAVYDNIAVISICMPMLTVCIVYVYNLRCKPLMVNAITPLYITAQNNVNKLHEYGVTRLNKIKSVTRKPINQDDSNSVNGN